MANLIRESWTNLDSEELRLLLNRRIGGPGQVDSAADPNEDKLYLPLARESCRVAVTFNKNKVVAIEPGQAFDAAEWDRIASEIENSILIGPPKVGRENSFSSFRVTGSWRGARSGVQILPPSPDAPRPSVEIAEHPFILEFPIVGGPDDLFELTNHRRRREHRRMTLLLNVLLTARVSCEPRLTEHFWAFIPRERRGRSRFVERFLSYLVKIRSWLGWPPSNKGIGESRWLQRWFCASLDSIVRGDLSAPAAENLTEMESEKYYTNVGHDGKPLRVPSDLDDSICRYRDLSVENRTKFDRAIFWMDIASRQWTISVSSSFASLVSAIEALTDRGTQHLVFCEECKTTRSHEVPGATERFRSFFDSCAPGAALRTRRSLMYELRSGILHGSELMQLDQDLYMGLHPRDFSERDLHSELWSITRLALRNWLRNPPQ
jgi:hypothetical protein